MTLLFVNNRYKVIRSLGKGGFGETFLVEDSQMPSNRGCVLKQLTPVEDNPEIYQLVKERFLREAAILEDLGENHPQIPRLYASFAENQQFFLVQEYIEGETLIDRVHQQGCMSEAAVRQLLIDILPVLSYVHDRRIIHRDIKPDNIMMRRKDQKPVLIDFGAVRETMGTLINGQGKSTQSIIIGTPGFMASEQAAGRPTFASDLYSLGLTAIYLLTGKMPQELPTEPLTGDISWRQFVPTVSPSLVALLDRAISPSAQVRFPTAQSMLDALISDHTVISPNHQPMPTMLSAPPPIEHQPTTVSTKPGMSDWMKTLIMAGVMGGFVLAGLAITRSPQAVSSNPNTSSNATAQPSLLNVATPIVSPSSSPAASAPSPSNPVQKPSPPSQSTSSSSVQRPDPEQFIRGHYGDINNRNYDKSWSHLSPSFQRDKAKGYGSYTEWWNQVARAEVSSSNVVSQGANQAVVDANLHYVMKEGNTDIDQSRIYLEWNTSRESWEFVDKVRS
jgi:serine/threonine protein kinase, bacterial